MSFNITDALLALKPESGWVLNGNNYSDLEWLDETQTKPTEDEVNAKIQELKNTDTQKTNDKISAQNKLRALGLTDAEIKAL